MVKSIVKRSTRKARDPQVDLLDMIGLCAEQIRDIGRALAEKHQTLNDGSVTLETLIVEKAALIEKKAEELLDLR